MEAASDRGCADCDTRSHDPLGDRSPGDRRRVDRSGGRARRGHAGLLGRAGRAPRPRRRDDRPLPRAAPLGRALRRQGPVRGDRVHRGEPDPAPDRRRLHRGHGRPTSSPRPGTTRPTATTSLAGCRATGVPAEEIPVADGLRREPRLHPDTQRAFEVPDAALDPWKLVWANARSAEEHGARILAYHRVVELAPRRRSGRRARASSTIAPASELEIGARVVVNAAGRLGGPDRGACGLPRRRCSPARGS